MQVLVDCTGLHADPLLTGIQRVTREMLRHWPSQEVALCAARLDPARGLVAIDPASLALLLQQPGRDDAALRHELRDRAVNAKPLTIAHDTLIAVPDVFFDPARARFHQGRLHRNPAALAMLSYDFIPWLQPDRFPLPTVVPLMPYLRLIRDARHIAFISRRTRQDYATRIRRQPEHESGPILPLGADGLQMERQSWSPERSEFVALGSLDGRKNQHRIVEAFEILWRNGSNARLTLLGRLFEGTDRSWLDRAMTYPAFRWIDHPDQDTVAATLRRARATIYVSAVEGFGLPPVESLMVGIPVISTIDIPSLEGLPPAGHVRLSAADPVMIAKAVSDLLDDRYAATLWAEASSIRLPTWRDFGKATADWLLHISTAPNGLARAVPRARPLEVRESVKKRSALTQKPPSNVQPHELVLEQGPALEPRRSLVRRLGRRALRVLRPLAAPVLHRLDVRMRWAVDRTATAEALRELSATFRVQQAQAAFEIDHLRTGVTQCRSDIEELRSDLTIRLDALALSHLRSQTFHAGVARVEERFETIQAGLDRFQAAMADSDRSASETLDALIQRTDLLLQRRSILLGTEIAIRTDYGYLLVPLEDEALVLIMTETAGQLEPGTLAVLLSLLQPGELMVDVGANVGTLCVPAARQVGPGGRVIAIEPLPRVVSVLRRSLALNGLDERVELLECAVGETEGVGLLSTSTATTHSSLVAEREGLEQIEVRIRPIDACVAPGQRVSLIKLDVEGAELQAWRGMSRIIAENPELAVIVEFGPTHLARWGVTVDEWLDILRAPGFTPWEIDEASGRIKPLRTQGLAEIYSLNLLLLRQPPSSRPKLQVA